jgi:hypothetical protein
LSAAAAEVPMVEFEHWANTLLDIVNPHKPITFKQAMAGPHSTEFKDAIQKEYISLEEHSVFSKPMDLPPGKKSLDTKLVLRLKENGTFKARLCVRGFRQEFAIDYTDTFAPVAAYDAFRVFLSLLCSLDYELDSADVITAFLHSICQEEIYIKIPVNYPIPHLRGQVLRLRKTLYGLKQAPLAWHNTIDNHLKQIGFTPCITEHCIYSGTLHGSKVFLLLYVDDILIATPDRSTMAKIKTSIHSTFPITDNDPLKTFLNMSFIRDRKQRTIKMNVRSKIDALLFDFAQYKPRPHSLPADPSINKTVKSRLSYR